MPYTNIETIQARTGVTYKEAELTYVNVLISAVTNFIIKYTGREFVAIPGDYYYNGSNDVELEIDDFTEITALKEYNSLGELVHTFEATDYELRPLNGLPKDRIFLLAGTFCGFRYKVTGKQGYTNTCPEEIKMVATEIIANLLAQKGGFKHESIEGYSYTIGQVIDENPVLKGTLELYKKILI